MMTKQLEEHRNQTLELRKIKQKQAKIAELKKMLSQLNQIKRLRKQKLIKLGQYTENNSEDDNAFFDKIKNEAENLTNYKKDETEEDTTLKSDIIKADDNDKKRIDYNTLCTEYYKSSNKDIPSLIKTRTKWDKYLTYSKKGNSLPLGWPEAKSPTNGWEKYFL
ncbi:hypothetical protein K502DRAFT_150155 [Neoconidiobolus thromboides FSU 785]|nr:hypothetical protein K502DRAFT_150155 [Neoconidiobolus thromboides FSU 785]